MSLNARCQHCDGRLAAPEASFEGRRVRCPRCGEITRFRSEAIQLDSSSTDRPDKPPATVAWVGFAALALLILVGGLFLARDAVARFGEQLVDAAAAVVPADPATPVLRWLPRRRETTVVLRPEEMLRTPVMRDVRGEHLGLELLGMLERSLGVDVMKLQWAAASRASLGAGVPDEWDELNAAVDDGPPDLWAGDWIVVLRSRIAIDEAEQAAGRERKQHGGQDYFADVADIDGTPPRGLSCRFLADEFTLILAGERDIRRLIERGPLAEVSVDPQLDTSAFVSVVSRGGDWRSAVSRIAAWDGGTPPEPDDVSMTVRRLDSAIVADASFVFTNADAADDVAERLSKGIASVRREVAELDLRPAAGPWQFLRPSGQGVGGMLFPAISSTVGTDAERDRLLRVVDSIGCEADGTAVRIRIHARADDVTPLAGL